MIKSLNLIFLALVLCSCNNPTREFNEIHIVPKPQKMEYQELAADMLFVPCMKFWIVYLTIKFAGVQHHNYN